MWWLKRRNRRIGELAKRNPQRTAGQAADSRRFGGSTARLLCRQVEQNDGATRLGATSARARIDGPAVSDDPALELALPTRAA